jgi:hypothetical protein
MSANQKIESIRTKIKCWQESIPTSAEKPDMLEDFEYLLYVYDHLSKLLEVSQKQASQQQIQTPSKA